MVAFCGLGRGQGDFVHLAYLDEAGTDGRCPYVMFGAVIISPGTFGWMERFHGIAVEQLFESEEIDQNFHEFHASQLYLGLGPFEGVDEEKRFTAIRVLLLALRNYKAAYIYAAVDRQKLKQSLAGSARPLDFAFRMCALGIEDWARNQHGYVPDIIQINYHDQYLLMLDDNKADKGDLKAQLRDSYRTLRASHPYSGGKKENRLWHAHDAMYFGDSRDSVGIQMADLCNYFMCCHLQGIKGIEEFYNMLEPHTICAMPQPEWSQFRDFMVTHVK